MSINAFVRLCTDHPQGYLSVFFFIQIVCITTAAVFFCWKYSDALFLRRSIISKKRIVLSFLALTPLAIWHIHTIGKFIVSVDGMFQTGTSVELSEAFASMHQAIWGNLAYNASSLGVLFSSLLSVVAPLHEEILINGFIANWIIRRANIFAGLVSMPVVFTLAHVPAFGFGNHLWGLFFAGSTYILIRVLSGSVAFAILSHCFINILIFVPKWAITVLYHIYVIE